MKRFSQKVGLVTGGSEGIGLAIAQRLISEGAQVYIAVVANKRLMRLLIPWATTICMSGSLMSWTRQRSQD